MIKNIRLILVILTFPVLRTIYYFIDIDRLPTIKIQKISSTIAPLLTTIPNENKDSKEEEELQTANINKQEINLISTIATLPTTIATTELKKKTFQTLKKTNAKKEKKILLNFDDVIREHCPVENLSIGYTCLQKLNEFKIEQLNGLEKTKEPVMLYHTFWRIDEGKPHHLRVLILQILSFLATQDTSQSKFIIWLQDPFSDHVNKTLISKFGKYFKSQIVNVEILNFKELCSNGVFSKRFDKCSSTSNYNSVAFSDFVGFLVLYKYGGIYTDGDVFYLRDMRPFWNKNFVHRWSFTEDYNTAIMGLNLNRSKAIDDLYANILQIDNLISKFFIDLVGAFYPARIRDSVRVLNGNIYHYKDFEVFHSIMFDPAWLCNDGVLPRFNNVTVCVFKEFYDTVITSKEFKIDQFYGGAFSFHLHLGNCGKCQIDENSFFHHIESYFSNKIQN